MDCEKRDLVQNIRRHLDPLDFFTIPSPAAGFTVQPGAGASTGGGEGEITAVATTVGYEETGRGEENDVLGWKRRKGRDHVAPAASTMTAPGNPVGCRPFGWQGNRSPRGCQVSSLLRSSTLHSDSESIEYTPPAKRDTPISATRPGLPPLVPTTLVNHYYCTPRHSVSAKILEPPTTTSPSVRSLLLLGRAPRPHFPSFVLRW